MSDAHQRRFVASNAGFNGGTFDTVGTFMCGRDVEGFQMPALYRNLGGGKFADVSAAMRVDRAALVMGSNFGDLDNDGWLDFVLGTGGPDLGALLPNLAFKNDLGRGFLDVTATTGLGHLQKGHGVAFGDLDDDGDQDLFCELGGFVSSDVYPNALFENPGNANHWITLRLQGVQANRSAIGARIVAKIGARTIQRQIMGTSSYLSVCDFRVLLGIGDAASIDELTIYWPGREKQVITKLGVGKYYRVVEGQEPVEFVPGEKRFEPVHRAAS